MCWRTRLSSSSKALWISDFTKLIYSIYNNSSLMCGHSLQLQLFGNRPLRIGNYERWFVLLQCWSLQLVLCTYGRSMFRKHSAIDVWYVCDVRYSFLLTVGSCTWRLLTNEKAWKCLANKAETSKLKNLHMFCVRPCIEQNTTEKDRLRQYDRTPTVTTLLATWRQIAQTITFSSAAVRTLNIAWRAFQQYPAPSAQLRA